MAAEATKKSWPFQFRKEENAVGWLIQTKEKATGMEWLNVCTLRLMIDGGLYGGDLIWYGICQHQPTLHQQQLFLHVHENFPS